MTIKEIANLAGVSISTVSKIMNHKDENISPETRDKVLAIAKEYNYSPYSFAKEASQSKSFLIGVLFCTSEGKGRMLNGILDAAERHGYRILVCDSKMDPEAELKHITALCRAKIDGVIWEPAEEDITGRRKYFDELGISIAWVNCGRPDSYRIDDTAIIRCASEYVIEHGHKHFSLLADIMAPSYTDMLNGYRSSLFDHGLRFDENCLLPSDPGEWMLRIKSYGLTGVISADYHLSLRLYEMLRQFQYEIPYDFSILTLIDDSTKRVPAPELSSIIVPFYSFGEHVCKQLIGQCEQHFETCRPFCPDYPLEGLETLDMPSSGRLPKIIVVGSINIDITLNVPQLPSLGKTVTTSRYSILPGGKGINQAVGVSKLNHKVTLLGNVGNDLDAGLIYSCLKDYKIDSSGIQKDKSADTGKAYIQVQDDGESFITILAGANATLTAQNIRDNSRLFQNCAYCLLQTEISMEAAEAAAVIAKQHGAGTILKPSAVSCLSGILLEHTDILVPNRAEIALICGCPPAEDESELRRQAEKIMERGVNTLIITLGEQGCYLKNSSFEQHFPAADFIPMDNTGGSDAFISALSSYLLYGYDLCSAIQIATYAAGFCISRQGVVPALIDQTSLEKYINNVKPNLLKRGRRK